MRRILHSVMANVNNFFCSRLHSHSHSYSHRYACEVLRIAGFLPLETVEIAFVCVDASSSKRFDCIIIIIMVVVHRLATGDYVCDWRPGAVYRKLFRFSHSYVSPFCRSASMSYATRSINRNLYSCAPVCVLVHVKCTLWLSRGDDANRNSLWILQF